ncbi:MAG: SGNH/GDSL hydrolase family protein [Bryobacter sp.]
MTSWLLLGALLAQTPDAQYLESEVKGLRRQLMDWAGLTRYGSDNTEIKLKDGEQRVVFLGDEITENMPASFFANRPWFNRGIARQASAQMLVRFQQDVVSLKPAVVVIQAGLGDLAGYAGPATLGAIQDHYKSMVAIAQANKIKVVLTSATPVCNCPEKYSARRPYGKILGLNEWLEEFAGETGSVYVNYFKLFAKNRAIDPTLSDDGLLPNEAGYAKLTAAAEAAVNQALVALK